jgi:hypothetical protein
MAIAGGMKILRDSVYEEHDFLSLLPSRNLLQSSSIFSSDRLLRFICEYFQHAGAQRYGFGYLLI